MSRRFAQHGGAGIDIWIGGHRRNVSGSGVGTTRMLALTVSHPVFGGDDLPLRKWSWDTEVLR
jgi:hypothetical protein